MRLAIESNVDLKFPPTYIGKVTMVIDFYVVRPEMELYELVIIDTCTKTIEKEFELIGPDGQPTGETEKKSVEVIQGNPVTRSKPMTFEQLDQIASLVEVENLIASKGAISETERINILMQYGLLLYTQQECLRNEGMYYSEAPNWKIVK